MFVKMMNLSVPVAYALTKLGVVMVIVIVQMGVMNKIVTITLVGIFFGAPVDNAFLRLGDVMVIVTV